MASFLKMFLGAFSQKGKETDGALAVIPSRPLSQAQVLQYAAARERRLEIQDVACAAVVVPEDAARAAQHALGLVSETYNACIIQETRFALYVLEILKEIANERSEGRCPQDMDDIAILLGNKSPYEEGSDNAQYLAQAVQRMKEALFHVYVAAFQRQNIVYLPIHEHDQEALIYHELIMEHGGRIVRTLVNEDAGRFAGERLPDELPKLTIRFVGISQNPVENVTPPKDSV